MLTYAYNNMSGRLRAPAYVLLGLMSVFPLVDFLVGAWPLRMSLVSWRLGAFGQLSATAAAPLIALLLVYSVALAWGDRRALYAVGILTAVYALILIGASCSFPLDAIEMRRRVPQAGQSRFGMAATSAEAHLVLYAIGALVLAISAIRSAMMVRPSGPLDASSSLVMRNASLSGVVRPTPAVSMSVQSADPAALPPADE